MVNILFIQIDKSQHAIFFTSSSLIGINGDLKEKFQVQGTQKEILQLGRGNVTPPCRPQLHQILYSFNTPPQVFLELKVEPKMLQSTAVRGALV